MDKDQVETVEDTGEVVGTGNNDRLAMLNAINDQNDQNRADEFAEIDDSGQVTKFIPNEIESELPLADPQDEESTAKELQRMQDEVTDIDEALQVQPPKYKLKVNGQEKELTIDEIIAKAQKVDAADVYLAEAARIRKEAQEQFSKPVQPSISPQDLALQQQEERRAVVRAIQMGTEEEAMAALDKLQRPPPPGITPDEVNRTVDERLTFKKAVEKFESEYSDILSDPVLKNIAFQEEQRLLAQNPKRDYWDRYDEVGKTVRAWRDNIVKAHAPAVETKPAVDPNKQTRKAAVASVPKTASVKVPAPTVEDDTDESPGAVIANMAKARGGPQWMRN